MSSTQYKWIGRGSIAISICMCIVLFFQDRSLLLDSLNVARNIGERSFLELISPLNYEQSAPLLFLWISKLVTSIFGITHYSLRVLPLAAGIASLFLFLDISKKLLNRPYVYIALFWLGTHQLYARYATEYKQYMVDVFAALLIIWAVLRIQKLDKTNWWKFAMLGAVIVWLSMPSIFVIISSILYFFILQNRKEGMWPILSTAALIGISFVTNYFMMLEPTIGSDHMQNFHDDFFLEGRFWNLESLNHDFGLIISQVRMVVGKSGLAIGAFLILIATAIFSAVKKKEPVLILVVLPIIGAFGASLLGKYSILERLMLFALPLYIITACKGIEVLFSRWKGGHKYLIRVIASIAVLGIVVGFVSKQSFKFLSDPFEHEDNRSALIAISKDDNHNKSIICSQHAIAAYDYYTKYDRRYNSLELGGAIPTHYGDDIVEVALDQLSVEKEVWILANHYSEMDIDKLIRVLGEKCTIKKSHRAKRSIALLISK